MESIIRKVTYPAKPGAVQTPDRIFGVPIVLEFDEGEPGRIPGDPHVPQRTILGAGVLYVVLARVVAEVTDVHLDRDEILYYTLKGFEKNLR